MNDRDCESCKKFSRVDPLESEGYCDAKRTWVDPEEGEDCKMHEFTLHSATKYKDGTPIMTEPEKIYCETDSALIHGKTVKELSNQLDYLERAFKGFAKTQDDLIEEYDATLKIHGDTLEQHLERIDDMDTVLARHACKINSHTDTLQDHHERITINEGNIDAISSDVEDLQRKVYQIYQFLNSVDPDFFAKIEEQIHSEPPKHNCNNFCGNCSHVSNTAPDGLWRCILSGEPVDPDDSSCSMFEPPF